MIPGSRPTGVRTSRPISHGRNIRRRSSGPGARSLIWKSGGRAILVEISSEHAKWATITSGLSVTIGRLTPLANQHDRNQALAVAKRLAIDLAESRQKYLGQSYAVAVLDEGGTEIHWESIDSAEKSG
jgi:hypothetical protein